MSRKKREDRIRAAEKAKTSTSTAAQLDQMTAGLSIDPTSGSWWTKLLAAVIARKWLLGILGALLAGGVIFGVCTFMRYRMRTIPGTPVGELIVTTPQGSVVIVIDYVALGGGNKNSTGPTTKGHRLTAIDAATGDQLAVDVTDHQKCWAGGTRVWCLDEYRRLILLDPRTLATVKTAEELIAAARLAKPTDRYDASGDDVVVHLSDGRGARISGTTLEVGVLETIPWQQHQFDKRECDKTSRIALGATTLVLSSGTRNTLTSDPPPPAESATPQGPALTFLDGGFLSMWPPAPLVMHRTAVGGPHILTRVDGISRARWTVPLDGTCRYAQLVGDTLLVTTSNPARRAIALDVATGGQRWQFGR